MDLAACGARVIIGYRNLKKDKEGLKEVQECSGNENIFLEKLDLASVCTFADKILNLPL